MPDELSTEDTKLVTLARAVVAFVVPLVDSVHDGGRCVVVQNGHRGHLGPRGAVLTGPGAVQVLVLEPLQGAEDCEPVSPRLAVATTTMHVDVV